MALHSKVITKDKNRSIDDIHRHAIVFVFVDMLNEATLVTTSNHQVDSSLDALGRK